MQIGLAVVKTAMTGADARHIADPATIARTIFVDAGEIRSTDFSLSPQRRTDLIERGRYAAEKWVGASWEKWS